MILSPTATHAQAKIHSQIEASFIPEIRQGHKNGGEGFWIAMEKLEGIL